MANNNFIIQNGLSIGGSAGATISTDPASGAMYIVPAPTSQAPNPTAMVFTTSGTITAVATVGGVANVANVATASNTSTASGTTTFSNISIPAGGSVIAPTVTASTVNAATIGNTGAALSGATGAFATSVTTATVTASTVNAATIGNASAVLYGTLNSSSASQPNITTLAGVTSIGTSGVTTTAAGNFTITGSLTVNGTTTTINNTTYETTEYVTTINATNVNAATIGNASAAHSGATATLTGLVTAATVNAATIGNASAVLYGTLNSASASQTNITAVGTLAGLTVSAAIVPNANTSVNLGSTSVWWNNIYGVNFVGTSTSAKYADLAENYQANKPYIPGTVLQFGGANEVTVAEADTTRVAGVVSTNPATLMNAALSGANVVALALTGRVPCMVIGPVAKGDIMVSAGFGFAKANNSPAPGQAIGKALEDFVSPAKGVIEVVVGRI